MRLCFVLILCIILGGENTFSQSPNDNMANAQLLEIGTSVDSHTRNNTVEQACIDESLTDKCIKYHNDQWYFFKTEEQTHLYINLQGQQCRDLLGVQLVVLEGELCSPDTYSIIDCVSLATQDDIYVELDHLEPFHQYWINVDGYLHDFCSFEIEVNPTPKGFSAQQINILEKYEASKQGSHVTLQWAIPDSILSTSSSTLIYRRTDDQFRYSLLAEVPVQYNAFGSAQQQYEYIDSLKRPDYYYYRMVLQNNAGKQYFVAESSFRISDSIDKLSINLECSRDDEIVLEVRDEQGGAPLDVYEFYYNPTLHQPFILFTSAYKAKDIRYLEIKVMNKDDDYLQTYYADLATGLVKKF
ncbi:hypothetical protein LVD15_15670 [Fulvivirga maritima]|uniref:hypothetical protein n=1 Tax=Fulvivirga maritima TaxID=2904247 RepID=UPI001F1F11E0|nr:hypothetical protein [Fulvivirga maritima]UII24749.1 hypothetical protein LVD15_15670 [Fulvivirga maritima]